MHQLERLQSLSRAEHKREDGTDPQVGNSCLFLKDVGGVSPRSQSAHGCQVTAVASHGLHHKHTALGASGRLLDAITYLMTQNQPVLSQLTCNIGAGRTFINLFCFQSRLELDSYKAHLLLLILMTLTLMQGHSGTAKVNI